MSDKLLMTNRVHPNLAFWGRFTDGIPVDKVTGTVPSTTGSPTYTADGYGSNGLTYLNYGNLNLITALPFTFFFKGKPTNFSGDHYLYYSYFFGSGFESSIQIYTTAGRLYIDYFPRYNVNHFTYSIDVSSCLNTECTYIIVFNNSDTVNYPKFYIDGSSVARTVHKLYNGNNFADSPDRGGDKLLFSGPGYSPYTGYSKEIKIYKGISVGADDALRLHQGFEPLARA